MKVFTKKALINQKLGNNRISKMHRSDRLILGISYQFNKTTVKSNATKL